MDLNRLSPYIRRVLDSTLSSPFTIQRRVLYDYELIYVQDGSCRLWVDGRDYFPKRNEVVLLRPDVPHSFHSIDGIDFVQPHIHFDLIYHEKSTETPISFLDRSGMTDAQRALIQEDILDSTIPVIFTPEQQEEFARCFFRIFDIWNEKKPNYQLLYKADLLHLLAMIFKQFLAPPNDVEQGKSDITVIKDYLGLNFAQTITLDALSKQFYINKFTLMRKFKQTYGQNVMEYYARLRLKLACRYLTKTNFSVRQIGELLDYSDAYSFSRFFKKEMGIAPLQYRKSKGM